MSFVPFLKGRVHPKCIFCRHDILTTHTPLKGKLIRRVFMEVKTLIKRTNTTKKEEKHKMSQSKFPVWAVG